jgi:hypothetical protein
MSEVHVLTAKGRNLELALHIPIPAGNNLAGVSWQSALVTSGLGGTTVLKDGDGTGGTISGTEKTAIVSTGSVFERVVSYDMGGDFDGLSTALKNARIDAVFAAAKAEAQSVLQARLQYFGYTRAVP